MADGSDPDSANPDRYEIAVVGTGMIGACAARHLAELGHRVVAIGAPEPEDPTASDGPFASHNDEGRITRIVDKDPIWSRLAAASIARYGSVAERSGIDFHHPVGLAWIDHDQSLADKLRIGETNGAAVRLVTESWLQETTGIAAPDAAEQSIAYEEAPAGLVNPRRLVAAQLRAAALAGATVVTAPVTGLADDGGVVAATGPFGTISAERMLLATGAYGARLAGVRLAMTAWPRTTLRVELDDGPAIPSLIAHDVGDPEVDHIYWVPPVRYPDGRTMLKIGGAHDAEERFTDAEEIGRWFRSGGSTVEVEALRRIVSRLLPDRTVLSWEATPCVTAPTETGYPYVGWIDDRVAVAVGGNGGAAKSCDEIGRLAANLFNQGDTNRDTDRDRDRDTDAEDLARFQPVTLP